MWCDEFKIVWVMYKNAITNVTRVRLLHYCYAHRTDLISADVGEPYFFPESMLFC